MKDWLFCLPVMRMAACPDVCAGIFVCQVSVSGWPSMLAVSTVGAVLALILPGLPCHHRRCTTQTRSQTHEIKTLHIGKRSHHRLPINVLSGEKLPGVPASALHQSKRP